MSSFSVQVRRVTIEPHPGADRLDCGVVDGYRVVVQKGVFADQSLAVYIPEQAIVPDGIIAEMGLEGRLAGSNHNRVKAIRLRGELSQGLLYRPAVWPDHWVEGVEVGPELGIVKHEPPIPIHLAGKMEHCTSEFIRTYDIESIKKFPNVIEVGERVVVSEKLHGTNCQVGVDGDVVWVSSKGISERGFCLVEDDTNTYWKAARQYGLVEKVRTISEYFLGQPVILFGEVLGVQKLRYGLSQGELSFHAFDLYVARRGFLSYTAFLDICDRYDIPTVPILYDGPYSPEKLEELTSGQTTLAGGHIREGVVVRCEPKRFHPAAGRVVFKSVSPKYLLGMTEEDEVQ